MALLELTKEPAPAPPPAAERRPRRRRSRGPGGMGPQIALSLLPGVALFTTFFVVPLGILVVTSLGGITRFHNEPDPAAPGGRRFTDVTAAAKLAG